MTRRLLALLGLAALLTAGCSATGGNHGQPAAAAGPGLAATESGYTLSPIAAPAAAGRAGTLSFRITGPDGAAVTRFDTEHDKLLHLIVARADTSQYQHVHPTMAADGTWSVPWTWPTGGTYRVFADSTPTGGPGDLVLSRPVTVSGDSAAIPVPAPARVADVAGFRVRLDGTPATGGSMLTFTITEAGAPVTDLDRYLGAYGHLVALRTSDLAYLHVHPLDGPAGPAIAFHAEPPTTGQYRLFLDFSRGGQVHTAVFTADAVAGNAATSTAPMPGMTMPGMGGAH